MTTSFLTQKGLFDLTAKLLEEFQVAAPVERFATKHLHPIGQAEIEKIALSGYRTVETIKAFAFKPIEKVSEYFGENKMPSPPKYAFLGLRSCDLEGLEVLDRVFGEGDYPDTFYQNNRQNWFLIGTDCTDCGQSCFCVLMNGRPYSEKNFDLNLSPIQDGYVVETGSKKGEEFVKNNAFLFQALKQEQLQDKENNRVKMFAKLESQNQRFGIKHNLALTHKKNLENSAWKSLTKDCVECSACNFICPTCSCFLLIDSEKENCFQRDKLWDACLKAGYARLAGGANPRGKLYQRLQNRYQCKCDYSYDRLGRYTCVGCGRCIDGCAGNIDMRKIFAELERLAPLTAKLE
jgi:NAD-dependent dihydropyrimidine dehydrogenase PreA subunit